LDRLIALVRLRATLELRAAVGSGGRLLSLVVALPGLGVLSLGGAFVAFAGLRLLERSRPELVLPALSGLAAVVGLGWVLSPLLAGVAATEAGDLTRLLHYPVPLATLVAASLLASLGQPLVLAQLPPLAAVALALAGSGARLPVAFGSLVLGLAFTIACGQAVAIALHALARKRRWHDRALVLGIVLGMVLSLLPIMLLSAGGGLARRLGGALLERDAFVLLPFSWGARAAVYAGRGEPVAWAAWTAATLLAVAGALAVSAALAGRLYRGELDLGEAPARAARRAAMRLPGAVGALVEKDLRVTWRDPRLKALVFTGLVAPVLILAALWQGITSASPGLMLALGSFAGFGTMGANVFALERQGLALLLGFPVPRSSVLVAKNLVSMALRLPALALIAVATLLVAGPRFVPAVVTVLLLTQLLACGVDNYVSVLLPVPVAAAGRDPNAPVAGTRGIGTAFVGMAAALVALAVSAPFAFLAWLPYLLETPWLWSLTLPLALAGAVAVYFMLVAGAARLVERREPDLVARAIGDE
jgi:ABC-2 type transport system permease protein